jgi:catechol 2,3-dioxygenase-like lactoylglutathione lyase family enzyme
MDAEASPSRSITGHCHAREKATMLSHVHVGIANFERSYAFYSAVMKALGYELKFCRPEQSWAGWTAPGKERPLFFIGLPYDRQPADAGNGNMTAFLASTREAVDHCYAVALGMGGRCEGMPGLRPHYHPNYYGAYFRDPDGNKICVCCHEPAPG